MNGQLKMILLIKQHHSLFFMKEIQLHHNQVLVLEYKNFHCKVLSRLYRNCEHLFVTCVQWAWGEKISHLSNRNETKWSKTNLFAYLCSYKSSIRVTMTGNNNVYKTIWKKGNKEWYKKYMCCFFTIWNLKSAITYKRGREELSRTSVCFATSILALLFYYSFHVPFIILFNVYFYIVRSVLPFLFNRSQSKASVVNQMSNLFFWSSKIFFCSFQLFENGHIHNIVSTLINVVKLWSDQL